MTRMRLLVADFALDGKGTVWGVPGDRRGRFLSETSPPRFVDIQALAFIQVGDERMPVTITDCTFGGIWGVEASFHEIPKNT